MSDKKYRLGINLVVNVMKFFNKLIFLFKKDNFLDIKKVDVLLIRSDSDCYCRANTRSYYSPHINTLRRELMKQGYSYLVIAKPFGYISRASVEDGALNLSATYMRYAILKKILFFSKTFFWKKVIQKSNAKFIICIMPSIDLCNASYDLNVWLADLQHGVITQSHPYYGKDFIVSKKIIDIPKHFLLWDKSSEQIIAEWKNTKNVETTIIGNLALLDSIFDKKNKHVNNFANNNLILISLQWGLDEDENSSQIFYENILSNELIKVINDNLNYKWFLRLHPVQLRDSEFIFQKLAQILPNDVIIFSKQHISSSLLDILMQTKIHITYNSSVTIEAAKIGVPTILLDSRLNDYGIYKDYFFDEKKSGIAKVVENNYQEINICIEKILKNEYEKKIDFTRDKKIFYDAMHKLFPKKIL